MPLEPGNLIAPNLRLERELSSGGMSSVWVARHLGLQAEVAVKVLSPDALEGPTSTVRFAREAKSAAKVDSPHVIRTFDFGLTDDGDPYIVMELLDGIDLVAFCTERGPLSLQLVEAIVRQLAKALDRAHRQDIVHRDIKPGNIFLLDPDGDVFVKLIDFGIAKVLGAHGLDMTQDGSAVGTPNYMSPEQLEADPDIDHRSDLWSVGVVAFRALSGQRPFHGDSFEALSEAIRTEEPLRMTDLRPDLPAGIDDWFARVFQRDRDKRFDSAVEMSAALTRLCVGVVDTLVSTPPPPMLRPKDEPTVRQSPSVPESETTPETFRPSDPAHRLPAPGSRAPWWWWPVGAAVLGAAGAWWWTDDSATHPTPPASTAASSAVGTSSAPPASPPTAAAGASGGSAAETEQPAAAATSASLAGPPASSSAPAPTRPGLPPPSAEAAASGAPTPSASAKDERLDRAGKAMGI